MLHVRSGRKHGGALEEQVARFSERNGTPAGKRNAATLANGGNGGRDGRGIDGGRLVACQPQKYGAIGSVTDAGKRERSIQIDLYALDPIEKAALDEAERKKARRAHGAHGVRTRRADAD